MYNNQWWNEPKYHLQKDCAKVRFEVPYSYFDKCTAYFADADYSLLIDYHWWRVSNQMCCWQDIDWDQLEMKNANIQKMINIGQANNRSMPNNYTNDIRPSLLLVSIFPTVFAGSFC